MPFDATPLSQTKRDLIAARQLLIEKGWVPHPKSDGPYCIGMAIFAGVCGCEHKRSDAPMRLLARLLGVSAKGDYASDAEDMEIYRIEPVLALLDEAIAAA